MRKTLQEHIDRMKYLSKINENTNTEAEFNNMLDDPNAINAMTNGIGLLLKDITDELDTLGREVGDKDGEIEMFTDETQVGESIVDHVNEAVVALGIGTALATPKIIDLLGKGTKQLGLKVNNSTIQKIGGKLSDAGHKMHSAYSNTIKSGLKRIPNYTNHTDDQLDQIANGIILAATIGFGIASMSGAVGALKAGKAGLAAVESGLTGVKGAEIAKLGKKLLPNILNGFAK